MASNRWASGSVAGVALTDSGSRDLRTDVLDGEGFKQTLVGNTQEALDLTQHVQLLARASKGIHFGIHIAQAPATKIAAIVTAIDAALSGSGTFRVTLSDSAGSDTIDADCVPDYATLGGQLYKRGKIAAGYMFDVQMRFVATNPH